MEITKKIMDNINMMLEADIDVKDIDINSIEPEAKDWQRAEGLQFKGSTFNGNNQPFASEASKMARLIKDPNKLVRRAMAVYAMYGTKYSVNNTGYYDANYISDEDKQYEVFEPFKNAMVSMGFTNEQIEHLISKAKTLKPLT